MSEHTSRRSGALLIPVLVLILVWLLVCGGMGWATSAAMQLDRMEKFDTRERAIKEARTLALVRLDALMAPILHRESARPYEQFRAVYKPTSALDTRDGSRVTTPIVIPSPLRNFSGPEWLLLHFQASESYGWTSPQLERREPLSALVGDTSKTDPVRQAAAEAWLNLLEARYTPLQLLSMLEENLWATSREGRAAPGRGTKMETEAGQSGHAEPITPENATTSELARRGTRVLEMQRENNPVDRCEPQIVARANLESSSDVPSPGQVGEECIKVSATMMVPVWLDLMRNGQLHLAFLRSVTTEASTSCTLQGLLIDWDALRQGLEAEVRDVFPDARLVPVRKHEPVDRQMLLSMMQTLPARLDSGVPGLSVLGVQSDELPTGLVFAWIVAVLALLAITYGVSKFASMAQRRLEFVAAVTHELRTPLTSFQLYADLLSETGSEEPVRRGKYVQTLRTQAKRLARLVENVLIYSKMSDSRPRLDWKEVSTGELLRSVAGSVAETCTAAGKELVIEDGCPPGARVCTDVEFVAQILTNLIENACKYSAGASDNRIWLSTREMPDGSTYFEVDDAGLGIAPRDRRAVFKPFRRSSSARAGEAGGLGLGLGLSRYWAECLGGSLHVRRSNRNGSHFTCFELHLPVVSGQG
jgi:signal transduction histidine kinase